MRKLLLSTLCVFVSMVAAIAQNTVSISGLITDRDTKEAVMMVTVQVLNSDSTFIKGVLSDEHGKFFFFLSRFRGRIVTVKPHVRRGFVY